MALPNRLETRANWTTCANTIITWMILKLRASANRLVVAKNQAHRFALISLYKIGRLVRYLVRQLYLRSDSTRNVENGLDPRLRVQVLNRVRELIKKLSPPGTRIQVSSSF